MRQRSTLLLTLAALAAIVLFVSLGRWQLGRAEAKQAMIEGVERALAAPPQPLAAALAADDASLPVRVEARAGAWLDLPPILLDNQVRERRNGVLVYRLWREAGAPVVVVEQAWLPWGPQRRVAQLALPEPGAAPPEGLLTAWPGQALALAEVAPPPQAAPWLVARLDRNAIAAAYGLALFDGVLRTGSDAAQRVRGAFEAMPPARHRGYALQWFALAATVAIIFGVLAWTTRRRR